MKPMHVGIISAFMFAGSVQADISEPDDDGAQATPLTVSTNILTHGPHTLTNSVDTSDWFSFELTAGKRYRFESTGNWDVRASLYSDIDGIVSVAEDDDSGKNRNFQMLFVPAATQTYYLEIVDVFGGYSEYYLEYREEAFYDAWDPADNVFSNAPTLSVNAAEQVHGEHNLSETDEEDWFHFSLISGTEYTLRAVNGGWDTVGELYYNDVSGAPVADGDDDYDPSDIDNELNFIITYTPSVSGNYYLKVRGYDVGDLNYSLIYSRTASTDSDGDGMSDADEAIAGTDLNDDTSYFAITNWSVGSFIIGWPAYSGREYQVYWTDHLTNGFMPLGPVIDYPQNSYTDTTHSAESSGFYKVEVQLAP